MSKSIAISLNVPRHPCSHDLTDGIMRHESFELEYELWSALNEIADREDSSIQKVCLAVYMTKPVAAELEAAVRYFIFDYFRTAATEVGHLKAGHGRYPMLSTTDAMFE